MKILWLGLEQTIGLDTHEVCIMNKHNFDMEKAITFSPDIIIEREFNDGVHIWDKEIDEMKERLPKTKTAVWLIDTHVALVRHLKYISHFDFVFMAISKHAAEFSKFHPQVYWLPLCFPATTLPPIETKQWKVGFVGRMLDEMEDRKKLLDAVASHYKPKVYHFVTDYETVYSTMSKCEIMLNRSFADDLNFRVFEALGCGNILITNDVPDIKKIKGLRDRLYISNTPEGTLSIIDSMLFHQSQKIGLYARIESNRKFIADRHMIQHRAGRIIEVIEKGGRHETMYY